MNADELRSTYPVFSFDAFEHEIKENNIHIHYHYSISTIESNNTEMNHEDDDILKSVLKKLRSRYTFTTQIIYENIPSDSLYAVNPSQFETFFFHIGLIDALSYWKAVASPFFIVKPYHLTDVQMTFFLNVLKQGMGEYFYKNNIKGFLDDFVRVYSLSDKKLPVWKGTVQQRSLIPVGGGKDSAVTIGLFKEQQHPFGTLVLNPVQSALDIVKTTSKSPVLVKRLLDPSLTVLNQKGFLNGHTPFSALLAWVSVTAAALYDYNVVVLSNERSAEQETTIYDGHRINHQFTKTYEFEDMFRTYLSTNVTKDISYLSLLRPLYEIQIAKIFSTYPEFFQFIKSCNKGNASNQWCGKCPKCVSTFIILFPFLPEHIVEIVGHDIFNDSSLMERVTELIDSTAVRPFECVGTREENILGLQMAFEWYEHQSQQLPPLLTQIRSTYPVFFTSHVNKNEDLLTSWGEHNFLTLDWQHILKKKLQINI